jgi:hypothetical protein
VGTFHSDKGELHGLTVVVDTDGAQIWVGRCDTYTDTQIVLLDADVHEDGTDGKTKQQFVQQAAKLGHWNRHPHVVIPRAQITQVKRLGEVTAEQ